MQDTPSRPCAPRARCGRFRECPICARIRQARIADAAERLQSKAPDLTWTTIVPDEREWSALVACRDAFLRQEAPEGAIWTVEVGQQAGRLHANILHPTSKPRVLRHAGVWQAPIRTSARIVAAYISKREQMPARDEYDGRLFGTAGPLWQWLATGKGLPVIEAAKTQYDIDPSPLTRPGVEPPRYDYDLPQPTWNEARAIAARRIPDLLRATPLYGRARTPKP